MKFNDIEKPYISVLRGRVRPFFAPLQRESRFDGKLIKTDRGHRVIEVPVWVKYNNMGELRKISEDIAEWLVHDEPKRLEFADEPDRFYYAVVDNTMNEDVLYNVGTESVITFICGYKYSEDKELLAEGNHIIYGHKSTTWKTQTIFTETATSYEFKFYRAGHDTSLRNINAIKINYQFKVGDTLVIDFSRRAVLLNDNDITNSLVILQSNFMELPVGEVIFEATEETEVFYNERYY